MSKKEDVINTLQNRAESDISIGQFAKAVDKYKRILHLTDDKTDKADICFRLGQVYELLKRHNDALEQYNLAIDNNKSSYLQQAQVRIGVVLHRSHKYREAIKHLSDPYEGTDNKGEIEAERLFFLASSYSKIKKINDAVDSYDKLRNIPEDYRCLDWELDNAIGFAHLENQQYDNAITEFKKAATSEYCDSPSNVYNNLGRAYMQNCQMDEAKTAFREAIGNTISPEALAYANKCLGEIFYNGNEFGNALGCYLKSRDQYIQAKNAGLSSEETADKALLEISSRLKALGHGMATTQCLLNGKPCNRNKDKMPDEQYIFVCMPFGKKTRDKIYFTNLYENAIVKAIDKPGINPIRADQITSKTTYSIVCNICKYIQTARIVVADISDGGNPNVMYEVGLAHAFSKEVVLLLDRDSAPPFDLGGLALIKYSSDDDLKKQLSDKIEALIK